MSEEACRETALRNGHTLDDADMCDDGALGCPDCPWGNGPICPECESCNVKETGSHSHDGWINNVFQAIDFTEYECRTCRHEFATR